MLSILYYVLFTLLSVLQSKVLSRRALCAVILPTSQGVDVRMHCWCALIITTPLPLILTLSLHVDLNCLCNSYTHSLSFFVHLICRLALPSHQLYISLPLLLSHSMCSWSAGSPCFALPSLNLTSLPLLLCHSMCSWSAGLPCLLSALQLSFVRSLSHCSANLPASRRTSALVVPGLP